MKILKSLPDIDQKDFFDRYANLIPTLFWLGVLAQIVSFFTELSIVYNIVSEKLLDLPVEIAPDKITAISWTASIILSLFFEVGLRKFIPYSVRAFLYSRWQELDKAMSYFIMAVAVLLVGGSVILSYKGSKELVGIASKPKKETTIQAEETHEASKQDIVQTYRADSTNIVDSYGAQIAGIETKFKGLIQKQESEIALYERKEQRQKKSYASRKQVHRGNIAKLQSEQGGQIAALQGTKRTELSDISRIKRHAIETAKDSHDNQIRAIERRNISATNEADIKANLYGGGLAWFTILAMAVFILSVVIDEIHKKGSGIVEQVIIEPYDFSQSAFIRFLKMLKGKWQSFIHSKITDWEKTTPAPTLPVIQHELFDIANIEQERIIVEVEKLPDGKYIIPSKLDKSLLTNGTDLDQKGFSKNLNTGTESGTISATIKSQKKDGKRGGIAHRVTLFDSPDFTDKADIDKANKDNDRNKNKHKAKQRKRILKFYKSYQKKYNSNPSYEIISDKLGIAKTSVGRYVRELKEIGQLTLL